MRAVHRAAGVSRRTWRAAVVLFLVVFLGGMGLTGANAWWSQQGSVQTTVTTGTWGPDPSPIPTPAPTPTPEPTEPTTPPAPWDWGLTLSEGDKVKGEGVVILAWTPPTAGRVVVEVDGAARVEMLKGKDQAEVTLGRGPGCYPLTISAVSADGTPQLLSGAVTFHPGGGQHGTFTFTDKVPLCR
ncbi:SipW-dependent-type signal peptide-containing protein [Microbacterium sp. A93]|uniref:SipW-dependent-type signal peptide-containing protein n=1 Tax=Microbacterium sp. A93 TaxID=3450716 RepID=UPI003F44220E